MSEETALHVIFGTGPVGRTTMRALHAAGKRVRMVNRRGRTDQPEDVEVMAGDASDLAFTRQAAQGATVIYQALNPAYHLHAKLFPGLQSAVLAAAEDSGATLVTIENLYMYGRAGGQPMTEEMPYRAHTDKGIARARMAEELMEAHARGRARTVIARAADFFGPEVTGSHMGDRVFPQALAGKTAQVIGNPNVLHTITYVPDVARALILLGERDEALGQIWHVPSPETLTTRQFIERVYAAAGTPPKIQALPAWLGKTIGFFNPTVKAVMDEIYQFEEPFIMNHSKFVAAFGDISTPLDEAIRTTLAWYQARYMPQPSA